MGDDDQVRTWVEFRWGNGTTMRASHSPPEVSETVVRSPHDLASIPGLQQALRGYAAEKGLAIAWSAPVREPRRDLVDSEYRDPDPGLNAIVRLSHDKAGRLVSISLSMAP